MSYQARDLFEGILEIFAEAQGIAPCMMGDRQARLDAHVKRKKSEYNSDEHGRRQRDPATRAARAESKRNAYAARVARPVQTKSKDPAVQREKVRERQRRYAAAKRAAQKAAA